MRILIICITAGELEVMESQWYKYIATLLFLLSPNQSENKEYSLSFHFTVWDVGKGEYSAI